jgi:hypothetical protein
MIVAIFADISVLIHSRCAVSPDGSGHDAWMPVVRQIYARGLLHRTIQVIALNLIWIF